MTHRAFIILLSFTQNAMIFCQAYSPAPDASGVRMRVVRWTETALDLLEHQCRLTQEQIVAILELVTIDPTLLVLVGFSIPNKDPVPAA